MPCNLCSQGSLHDKCIFFFPCTCSESTTLKLQCLVPRRLWDRSKGGGRGVCVWWGVGWTCVCISVEIWAVFLWENTFARCFASEGPFLYENRIAFLRQMCWVSGRTALSFRRSFPEIGARNLLMVLGDRRGDAQAMLCFAFQSLWILSPCLCIFKIPFNI